MNRTLLILLTVLLAFPVYAFDQSSPQKQQTEQSSESNLTSHGHYVNKDGQVIHSPSATKSGAPPDGASAQCRDDTYSFSKHRSGTCSHHGGVAHWL